MNSNLQDYADLIRYYTLKELGHLGYGHFGGALSMVEALAVLYGAEMTYDPQNPQDENRDYFILSKGHAGPAYYAALSLAGFFPLDKLYTLNKDGTSLPSHPDRHLVEGVDMTTGSLGQGLSVAAGLAYRFKHQRKNNRVYCIVGDGELNEGQCWEALLFIAHHNLNNLIVLVDDNKKQLDGYTKDICNLEDLVAKFKAFNFHSEKVKGNQVIAIKDAIDKAKAKTDKPTVIVLDNIKGSGVSYLENLKDNHHLRLNEDGKKAVALAIEELGQSLKDRGLIHG